MYKTRNIRFLKHGEEIEKNVSYGISLHCHTLHSKEILDFVPYYAERIPLVSYLWSREKNRSIKQNGRVPSFASGYWSPPLTGIEVFDMEANNLANLGLTGIVSITDHDSIQANLEIIKKVGNDMAPISMEWTVPYQNAFFHIGVHNMPAGDADEMVRHLLAYTHLKDEPDNQQLHKLFAMLNACPQILVVLNHPVWDIEMIGQQEHERALRRFLADHAKWLHAIEVNGFRVWSENEAAIKLADNLGLPIVSGGDLHCLHSNTMINVSNAESFGEFVDEVRVHGLSRIIVTPEYKIPLPARQLASIAQILGDFSDFPAGRRKWSDRIHLDSGDHRGLVTLTDYWNGRIPVWTRLARIALAIMAHPIAAPLIGLTVGDKDIGREEGRGVRSTGLATSTIRRIPPSF